MRIFDSNEYINEKLNIKPVTRTRLDDLKDPEVDGYIRDFIKENNLKWNPVTKCYDCEGDVTISKYIVLGGKLKIRFGKVGGDFDCYNNNLTTLEGAPNVVGGYFDCNTNHLTTLEGAPQEVGGYFDCSNNKLTTLKGAPNNVGGDFYCINNPNLVLPEEKPSWLKGEIIS